ncbi:MAG: ARMT1-like domain-containing protein [Candidatus Omnitrophota bacterium]
MKTYKDCIPCFYKQAREAAKIAGATERQLKKIADELALIIARSSDEECPPYVGRKLYQLVIKITGEKDPFKQLKQESNELAIKLYPKLKKIVENSKDRLLAATLLAIVGNIIDYGAQHSFDIDKEIDTLLHPEFDIHNGHRKAIFEYDEFKKALDETDSVLYLADNSGEVVFDRVLIEEMNKKVIYVIRENPIINDALEEDALVCGIDKVARIISSGCDAPGVMLRYCNNEFLNLFESAKMIISKGQGNFEALTFEVAKPIFYLFRVKCDVVAEQIGFHVGDIVLKSHFKSLV